MIVQLNRWVAPALALVLSAGWTSCSTQPPPQGEKPVVEKSSAAASASEGTTWDSGPQEPLSQVDIDAIKAAVEKGAEHYRDGQFVNFSNKFVADGKVVPPDLPPQVGKSAIQAFARRSPKIDTLDVMVTEVDGAGNKATVTATVAMTGKTNNPDNGNKIDLAVTNTGTALIEMKKQGGTWLAKSVAYVSQSHTP